MTLLLHYCGIIMELWNYCDIIMELLCHYYRIIVSLFWHCCDLIVDVLRYSAFFRATIMQTHTSKVSHASTGSVAKPAILRPGGPSQSMVTTGSMGQAQYSQISNQAHSGHSAQTVR